MMYVLTNLDLDYDTEAARSVVAIADTVDKLKAHAQKLLDEEWTGEDAVYDESSNAARTLEWEDWGPGNTGDWLVAAVNGSERYDIEPVEQV